jgi:hypothetical protein
MLEHQACRSYYGVLSGQLSVSIESFEGNSVLDRHHSGLVWHSRTAMRYLKVSVMTLLKRLIHH